MADIDDVIAQGPGRRDFSPLADMFAAWRQGAQARREDALADARASLPAVLGADGRPDYGAAALHLLRAGDVHGATALAHVARAMAGRDPATSSPSPPRLATRADVDDVLRQAREARAAGRDPGLILRRLNEFGLDLSSF